MPEIHVVDVEGDRWDANSADEHLWWPRVLWIDPGVVSGVAVVWFDPVALFEGKTLARCLLAYSEMFLYGPESGMNGQVNRFLRLRRNIAGTPGLATGIERFVPLQFNQSDDFLSPVRIRAALDYALSKTQPDDMRAGTGEKYGVPLPAQSSGDAIKTFTNDRLKAFRMYTPGLDHVNDAKRHCLLWIRKIQQQGLEEFKKMHGYEPGWFDEEVEV